MKRTHRGEGAMKLVFSLAIVGATFYIGYKFIPLKVQDGKIEDCMVEEAKMAGTGMKKTPESIRDGVWGCIGDLEARQWFDKKDIQVTKGSSRVTIYLEYSREVELPGYKYTWDFVHDIDRTIY